MDDHGIRQELTTEADAPGTDRATERPLRTTEDPVARAVAVQLLYMRLSRCCSIDLEVSPSTDKIHALAGVRNDTEATYHSSQTGPNLRTHLRALDALAEGADFLIGHNVIKFDLPYLRAAQPDLRLLKLPVIDTLWLNPLAFPRFPYHHLVKHYREGDLRRHTRNDPELDARLALKAFQNQQEALLDAEPSLVAAWHWLCTGPDHSGFDMFFEALRRSPRPSEAEGRRAVGERLDGVACATQARSVIASDTEHGWSLAYALAWLSVCGGNSVMPPWVRHQFPEAGKLVRRLRDTACADPACSWCRSRHDARSELKRFFDFDGYRSEPSDKHGRPLQQAIVEAAMGGEHVLGILPTGTGKSICYQVPALSRYDKTGALTVVISPLVALMADQVAGLEAKGITSCVAISGMLTMPERADALKRLRLGDAAIVLCSPEQLRSESLRRALDQREIGAWVLDEAHCLSKWGHDFRPDYRYVGRFIRERAQEGVIPPVLCLTATAKPDVRSEIVDYFREQLNVEMRVFDGGSKRTNLEFEVVPTSEAVKLHDIHLILEQHLSPDTEGGAIVYCATRRHTEVVAGFLAEKGMRADRFHAGLQPEDKQDIQRSFIHGELQVIAATNAFGMGIDKPDVRLVVHADIPSSLENYLQEAGRAGRDQQSAHCVLLYSKDDVDRQFSMSARSRLTRREIHSVLRALRRLSRRNRGGDDELVASVGEILAEDEEHEFRRDSITDDTRARTAVMWLEDAQLLRRDENRVRVFASSLRVRSVAEARQRLHSAPITDSETRSLIRIVETLIESDPDAGVSTDQLMSVTGLDSPGVRRALWRLEQFGIASDDTAITAFVHHGVPNSSRKRLDQASAVERDLLDWMQELAPDLGVGEKAPLDLRVASQRLRDAGHNGVRPEQVIRTLRGVARDGHDEGGSSGSLTLRTLHAEAVSVTLKREWSPLRRLADKRRSGASRLLELLLSKLRQGQRGNDILVESTLGELTRAICDDLDLAARTTDARRLMEGALLWLHEQNVIRLNKGLTVFRSAMTIRLAAERRGFTNQDFESLQLHYEESTRQVHVMAEYAEKGLSSMADAIRLSLDYFALGEEEFLRRWLPNKHQQIARQTTPESWSTIVESLKNPSQRQLVVDDREQTNMLVLAGPGSGKTRVLVHRIAYLVRVRREDPRGILALAYNRHAAVEIRRRLADLIGDDSRQVTVLTCHALAMRLVGASFTGTAERLHQEDFEDQLDRVLTEAAEVLQGEGLEPAEAEEARERLLSGYRWILVDEYQDINGNQYELISALAGRTLAESDARLSLFAVGDDDQNIYSFTGASVEYIRRFEADYKARPAYLLDNYRSTRHIIDASNAVIEEARERMKVNHPIRVDRARAQALAGGEWADLDPVGRGRVQVLQAGSGPIRQAQAALAELKRLSNLDARWDWSKCAAIARGWKYLEPIRGLCDLEGIPWQLAKDDHLSVWQLRETQSLVGWLRSRQSAVLRNSEARDWLRRQAAGRWIDLLKQAVQEHEQEADDAETPVDSFVEWLAEWSRDARRRQHGLLLTSAHKAKGLEFDHAVVLDGGWERTGTDEDPDASRRLYYVAMSRARLTLTLTSMGSLNPYIERLLGHRSVLRREPAALPEPPAAARQTCLRLGLGDVFISFAGYRSRGDRVHRAIADLAPGDDLGLDDSEKRWRLLDQKGVEVGRLASGFTPPKGTRCAKATVYAVVTRRREQSAPEYQERLRCDRWEVVLPELIFEPAS